jgi:hypothetical protein
MRNFTDKPELGIRKMLGRPSGRDKCNITNCWGGRAKNRAKQGGWPTTETTIHVISNRTKQQITAIAKSTKSMKFKPSILVKSNPNRVVQYIQK